MGYTLGQAAKATGLSKSTILRAIRAGKVSAVKDEASGSYTIEPAELHRIYPPVASGDSPRNGGDAGLRLEEIRSAWERDRASLEHTIADLRNRLDASETERRTTLHRLTALLESHTPAPARHRWFRFRKK
jgi:excisionase family DNA binding protein